MAKTAEGKVKALVKEVLDMYDCYYFMPVSFGYGPTGLDFHCSVNVRGWEIAFWVETKEKGKDPTERQWLLINKLLKRGAKVFIVDDYYTRKELERWLEKVTQSKVVSSKPSAKHSVSQQATEDLSQGFHGGSVKIK